ncbi:hypothetical protein [Pedobacter gandavensis]|uniref:hypothetical protein n=1 Tax=Pedobacter gandavensis TaxID=2679963 RepID=UPI00292F02FD|nr:hypothetical protein [Pedobacter gandavensis]
MNRLKLIRYLFALLMICLMAGISEWLAEPEILFPEMAALVFGFWVIDKKIWTVRRPMLVLLMTICALFGVLLVRYSTLPLLANIALSFVFTSFCLSITRSTLIPITSASMLPVMLGTTSLIYPLSVFMMCILLVSGQWLLERSKLRQVIIFETKKGPYKHSPMQWASLLLTLLLISFIPLSIGKLYFIVPPLVVMFIEFSSSSAGFRNRPVQVYFLMLISAILGTLSQYYLHTRLGLPLAYTVLFLFAGLFLLFEMVDKPFAPACAIALVPMIIPQNDLLSYPFQVAIGTGVFLFAAMFFFLKCYRWKRTHLMVCFVPDFIRSRLDRPNRDARETV